LGGLHDFIIWIVLGRHLRYQMLFMNWATFEPTQLQFLGYIHSVRSDLEKRF
jgi:hypothetical protein